MFIFRDQQFQEDQQDQEVLPPGTKTVENDSRNVHFNHASQTLVVGNISKFIKDPVPFGLILSCSLRKISSGLITKTLRFQCSLQKQSKILAYAMQIEMNKFTIMSSAKGQSLIAILQSNFVGTQFRVANGIGKHASEIAFIEYEVNILGLGGPRRMCVYVPRLDEITKLPISYQAGHKTMKQLYQSGDKNICKFHSKRAEKDPVTNAYSLQFYGRAKISSVKNFILQAEEPLHFQSLIFGRQTKNQFELDVKYPLSLVQGLAICISSVMRKLGVQ